MRENESWLAPTVPGYFFFQLQRAGKSKAAYIGVDSGDIRTLIGGPDGTHTQKGMGPNPYRNSNARAETLLTKQAILIHQESLTLSLCVCVCGVCG
jgi:hypothetical protein